MRGGRFISQQVELIIFLGVPVSSSGKGHRGVQTEGCGGRERKGWGRAPGRVVARAARRDGDRFAPCWKMTKG
jgi:hypothetical protein